MKLLSEAIKLRQLRRSRWSILELRRENDAKRTVQRRRAKRLGASARPRRIVCAAPKRIRYYLPKQLRIEFESFAMEVERSLASSTGEVVIDFRPVVRLYPCGVLLLMGLVDDWLERFPGRLKAKYPNDDLVEQMLQQVEVLQKLGLTPRKEISHSDVTRWHYFSGMNVDAGKIEPFMKRVSEVISIEAQSGLYDCIAEAMTNVKHHAYEGGAGGHWWMFGTVSDKRVFVAMHDRGASIPATLLAKPKVRDYMTGRVFASGRADAQLITAASGGRTSTKLAYRGKGLPEMLEYTKATKASDLAIYSRQGFFRLAHQNERYFESNGNLQWPVKGTLILWMINLSGENQ